MTKNTKVWVRGLIATIVNGFASGVVLLVADPVAFNLGEGFHKLAATSAVFALLGLANYLKQHPLPDDDDIVTLRSIVWPLLFVASIGIGACATMSPRAQAVQTHQGIQTLLAAVDDAERVLCFGSTTLPAQPSRCTTDAARTAGLTDARHQALSRALVQAFAGQVAVGMALTVWRPGQLVDMSEVDAAAVEIDRELAQLRTGIPALAPLITKAREWIAEVNRLKALFQGGR